MMMQRDIKQFLVPTNTDHSTDVTSCDHFQVRENENIFVQKMKKRMLESNLDSNAISQIPQVVSPQVVLPQILPPHEGNCSNSKCVSIPLYFALTLIRKPIHCRTLHFQLMEKQKLTEKYENQKIKHAKLTAVLEDYQIRMGDLNQQLNDLKKKKTAERPIEPPEVYSYASIAI